MSKYVDVDKLCEALRERINNPLIVGWLIKIIRDQPTVDISEEKHNTSNISIFEGRE